MRQPEDHPVDRRLLAARPPQAEADPALIDTDLLAAVQRLPDVPRRRSRRAVIVAAAAAAITVVLLVTAGSPSTPRADAALTRALRWFDPPAGSLLYIRSRMTTVTPSGGRIVLEQESWQSVDHPSVFRHAEDHRVEIDSTGDLYDPSTDTVYAYQRPSKTQTRRNIERALATKLAAARRSGASPQVVAKLRADRAKLLREGDRGEPVAARPQSSPPAGDAIVGAIRDLLRSGHATVGASTTHDGVPAVPIRYAAKVNGPRTTLWTRADDGRPLELRTTGPGPVRLGATALETVVWLAYDVRAGIAAQDELSISAAHPTAHVVRNAASYDAAQARLFPDG